MSDREIVVYQSLEPRHEGERYAVILYWGNKKEHYWVFKSETADGAIETANTFFDKQLADAVKRFGSKWTANDSKDVFMSGEDQRGAHFKDMIWVTRDGNRKRINPDELSFHQTVGWEKETEKPVIEKPASTGKGKGANFLGTVWVANVKTKDKRRVPVKELDSYLAKGYMRAGPRTQV